LEDFSAARRAQRGFQCCLLRPVKFPKGTSTGVFSKRLGGKSGIFRKRSGFVIQPDTLFRHALFSDIWARISCLEKSFTYSINHHWNAVSKNIVGINVPNILDALKYFV
jgi:hypothetical protein